MGRGEPHQKLARRLAGSRPDRRRDLLRRQTRDDRHQRYGQRNPQKQLETDLRTGLHDQTRGWGLGLSLSRRVIEEYHQGRIGVVYSELAKAPISALPLNATSTDGPATRNTHGFAGRATVRQPADNRNGLRESIFRLRDSLATIPPDTLQATPPSRPKSCSEPVRHSRSNRFRRNPSVPYTNRPLSKGSYWPWFSLIWSSSTITCGKFISSVGN